MGKYYAITSNIVTTMLLCFSFLLDYYICNNTDNLFISFFSGACFLFFVPYVLLYVHIKNINNYINAVDLKFIKFLSLPFFLILIFSFVDRFIPDYNSHPVIYCLILSIEYLSCVVFITFFIKRIRVIINGSVNKRGVK